MTALPGDPGNASPSANAAGFVARADDVFGRIAGRYDVLCDPQGAEQGRDLLARLTI